MDVQRAAERIGTDEAQLRRFLRRVERGLGLRASPAVANTNEGSSPTR